MFPKLAVKEEQPVPVGTDATYSTREPELLVVPFLIFTVHLDAAAQSFKAVKASAPHPAWPALSVDKLPTIVVLLVASAGEKSSVYLNTVV